MRRAALIVDDSRVATAALKRMLEPHHMAIESAESGEEAIEYLRSNVSPAVVFLDHMMPGMDGFQVLGLLQKDPRLAAIPIVMYTSKEGEAYMGQALARGAFGVLRKPPSPVALLRILEQLRLTDEPVAKVPVAVEPAPASPAAARAPGARAAPVAVVPAVRPASPAAAPRTPAPSPAAPRVAPPEPLPDADTDTGSSRPIWIALYTLLLLAVSLWLLQQYRAADQARIVLLEENRALQTRASAAAMTPSAPEAPTAEPRAPRLLQALAWATNLHNQYGYDQLPLDDQRLALVRELVARLTQAGFEGVVRLETHVGEFCLTRDGFGGFKLPEPTAAIADCEIIGYSAEQATTLGRRQSPAFSRFLVVQSNARPPVRVEVVSYGNERPLVPYPNVSTLRTAGEWNNIAGRNHRVQIAIVPNAE